MKNFNNKSEDCIMFKNILFSMMFLVSSLLANTLGLEDNGDGTWNVSYSSEDIIAGFQFDVDDATVNSASGGDASSRSSSSRPSAFNVFREFIDKSFISSLMD